MPIKIKIYNQTADTVGEIDLADKIFNLPVKEALVHQAMVTQMANERQVLAHTKIRSEVRGGGKKPWRQKGTGRARAGSSRSPIWIGGGVTFGPRKDRNFSKKINKKMKSAAMLMVISDRVHNESLAVIENFTSEAFKTKNIDKILSGFETKVFAVAKPNLEKKAEVVKADKKIKPEKGKKPAKKMKTKRSILVINDKADETTRYSSRNLAGLKLLNIDNLNILDLLKYKNFIITKEAVIKLADRYGK